MNESSKPAIRDWSPQDRPREKLLTKGKQALSDAELIAMLIGSGTATQSAVDIAKHLLHECGNNLNELAQRSVRDLTKIKGLGIVRSLTIIAAMELGRRRKEETSDDKLPISSSSAAFHVVKADVMDLPHEEFWVILLNRANRLIRTKRISEGGVSGTVADPRIIFKLAIEELASGVIVVHNHPSGNLTASQSDIDLTRKLKEGSKLLDLQLLDHLIIAGQKYFSFADEGML